MPPRRTGEVQRLPRLRRRLQERDVARIRDILGESVMTNMDFLREQSLLRDTEEQARIFVTITPHLPREEDETLMNVSRSWTNCGLYLQAHVFEKETTDPTWRCIICLEDHDSAHHSYVKCGTCAARVCETSVFRLALATMTDENSQLKTACLHCPQCRDPFKIVNAG